MAQSRKLCCHSKAYDATDEDIYAMLKNVGYYIEYIDIARDKDRTEMTAKVDGEPLGFLKRIA